MGKCVLSSQELSASWSRINQGPIATQEGRMRGGRTRKAFEATATTGLVPEDSLYSLANMAPKKNKPTFNENDRHSVAFLNVISVLG